MHLLLSQLNLRPYKAHLQSKPTPNDIALPTPRQVETTSPHIPSSGYVLQTQSLAYHRPH